MLQLIEPGFGMIRHGGGSGPPVLLGTQVGALDSRQERKA